LAFSGLFEAELLIELMLRYWNHPLAADAEFRNHLLESAAEVLRASIAGQQFMEDLPPKHMNFVAAVWYVEWSALHNGEVERKVQRRKWLDKVHKAVPSCFCPPDGLK
jgi:hypothetical protein